MHFVVGVFWVAGSLDFCAVCSLLVCGAVAEPQEVLQHPKLVMPPLVLLLTSAHTILPPLLDWRNTPAPSLQVFDVTQWDSPDTLTCVQHTAVGPWCSTGVQLRILHGSLVSSFGGKLDSERVLSAAAACWSEGGGLHMQPEVISGPAGLMGRSVGPLLTSGCI
jgi:hypothetical protein